MDGREAMALSGGSASYYIHRGGHSGSSQPTGLHNPSGFRPLSNPGIPNSQQQQQQQQHHQQQQQQQQPPNRAGSVGPTFPVESSATQPQHHHHQQQQRAAEAGFPHGPRMGMASSEPVVKKKRGRPRKYGPDGPGPVSLRLSSMSSSSQSLMAVGSPGSSSPKRSRGRPPGTGRKQQLAQLGDWMNSSAGIAFAPHVITIGTGEDIVAKLLSFAQQRPRALCILSGSGLVSSVSLRQPASTGVSVTYEGRFQILCLSGSYLVSEDGGPRNRTGGVSASLASPDGHVVGGGVAVLIAASPVQVVVCSFVHGNVKPVAKNKQIAGPKSEGSPEPEHSGGDKLVLVTPTSAPPQTGHSHSQSGHGFSPSSSGMWPGSRPVELRGPHTGIDLTRG